MAAKKNRADKAPPPQAAAPASQEQKPTQEPAASSRPSPWIGAHAPWEEYISGIPVVNEDGKVVSIIEQGGGKLKIIEHAQNGGALGEEHRFEYGGRDAGQVIYSESNPANILLPEETKIRAMEMSYKFTREDPSYAAIIRNYTNFVIGKGLRFKAQDEDPKVQAYLEEFWRVNKMNGKDKLMVRRWMKTGEIAIRWYEQDANGRPAKVPKIRLVPFYRITKVEKDPEDDEVDRQYEVIVTKPGLLKTEQREALTPEQLTMWRNAEPEEGRGEPPFITAMKPAKWYTDWIMNRVTLNRYRTAHVLFKKIKGTPAQTLSVSTQAADANVHKGTGGRLEKRMPKPGTMVVHNEAIEYEWKNPNLGAGDAKEDGRAILLHMAAGAAVPEFFFGDASQANLANTFIAQNPFIRQVEDFQDLFEAIFAAMFQRVIEHGIKTGALPKMSGETVVTESSWMVRRLRRAIRAMGLSEAITPEGDRKLRKPVPTKTTVTMTWPTLIHNDKLQDAQTLQIEQQMGAVSIETIREKLGYDHETEERRMETGPEARGDRFAQDREDEIAAGGGGEEDEGEEPDERGEKPGKRAAQNGEDDE